jgi:hypothetical protein
VSLDLHSQAGLPHVERDVAWVGVKAQGVWWVDAECRRAVEKRVMAGYVQLGVTVTNTRGEGRGAHSHNT